MSGVRIPQGPPKETSAKLEKRSDFSFGVAGVLASAWGFDSFVQFPLEKSSCECYNDTTQRNISEIRKAERAKSGVLLEMGSNFFKQTPPYETCSEFEERLTSCSIATLTIFRSYPNLTNITINSIFQHTRMSNSSGI